MEYVYVVTSGEYSDYHIDAVFDSEEKALGFIRYERRAKPHNEPWWVESYPVNGNPDKSGLPAECVLVDFEGRLLEHITTRDKQEPRSGLVEIEEGEFEGVWGRSYHGKDAAERIARDELAMYKVR